jgi:hypothetical protein
MPPLKVCVAPLSRKLFAAELTMYWPNTASLPTLICTPPIAHPTALLPADCASASALTASAGVEQTEVWVAPLQSAVGFWIVMRPTPTPANGSTCFYPYRFPFGGVRAVAGHALQVDSESSELINFAWRYRSLAAAASFPLSHGVFMLRDSSRRCDRLAAATSFGRTVKLWRFPSPLPGYNRLLGDCTLSTEPQNFQALRFLLALWPPCGCHLVSSDCEALTLLNSVL